MVRTRNALQAISRGYRATDHAEGEQGSSVAETAGRRFYEGHGIIQIESTQAFTPGISQAAAMHNPRRLPCASLARPRYTGTRDHAGFRQEDPKQGYYRG